MEKWAGQGIPRTAEVRTPIQQLVNTTVMFRGGTMQRILKHNKEHPELEVSLFGRVLGPPVLATDLIEKQEGRRMRTRLIELTQPSTYESGKHRELSSAVVPGPTMVKSPLESEAAGKAGARSELMAMESEKVVVPVQLFAANSLDPRGIYHEGLPIAYQRTMGEGLLDYVKLVDVVPIVKPYLDSAYGEAQIIPYLNTLLLKARRGLCALDELRWNMCTGCNPSKGGDPLPYGTPLVFAEVDRRADEWMKLFTTDLPEESFRFLKLSCDSEENLGLCNLVLLAAIKSKHGLIRYLVLPALSALSLQYFLLAHYGLPLTTDARHAIDWSKVRLYQEMLKHAQTLPLTCGGPREGGEIKEILKILAQRGYQAEVVNWPLDRGSAEFLAQEAQIPLNNPFVYDLAAKEKK